MKQPSQQKTQQTDSDVPLQPLLTIPEVARVLQLSRPKIYSLIIHEGLPILRFGRAVRIAPSSLERWLMRREGTF